MGNRKYLPLVMAVLSAIVLCMVSCDIDNNDSGKPVDQPPDYSGLLAEYADKVTVPSPGDLPAFTTEMGIPVRDSIEAEMFLNAMLIGDYGNSVFYEMGNFGNIGSGSGNERKLENFLHGDFFIYEYIYSDKPLGDFVTSSKARVNQDINFFYSGITIYAGSLTNYWYLLHRGPNWMNDPWGSDTFLVDRSANGYIVSQGGFCAKIIVEFTYFQYGNYRGEGTVKVYGANSQELFVKKLARRSEFKDFLFVD